MSLTTNKFRLNSLKLFLTYPQSKLGRQGVVDGLTSFFKENICYYVVSEEEHKEDEEQGLHQHVYLILNKKCDIRNAKALDINGQHGNYLTMKKQEECLQYVTKEDKEPLSNFDWKSTLMQMKNHKRRSHNLEQYEELMREGPLKMVKTGSINYMNYMKAKATYQEIKEDERLENDPRIDLDSRLENSWGLKLFVDLDKKCCHFWIWSEQPNKGKTTFLISLMEKYKAVLFNPLEKYQDQIKRDTQLILFDEMRGGTIKISELNQICDGTGVFCQKGRNSTKLDSKPLVIVMSNMPWTDIYKEKLHPLIQARFISFCLD